MTSFQEIQNITVKSSAVMETILKADDSFNQVTTRNVSEKLTTLGTQISNLRNDLEAHISVSSELESKIGGISSTISYLESGSGPLTSSDDFLLFKSGIIDSMNDLHVRISDMESSFHNKIVNHMKEIENMNCTLESIMSSRQSHMETKMSTLAKVADLKSMEDSFTHDIQTHSVRLHALLDCANMNEQSISEVKQRIGLSSFHRITMCHRRSLFRKAISLWMSHLKSIEKLRLRHNARTAIMRRIVIRCWYSKKVLAFKKWREFINSLKSIESHQEQALRFQAKISSKHIHEPLRDSVHIWRRYVVSRKASDQSHHSDQIISSPCNNNSEYTQHSIGISTPTHLHLLLQSLKNDKDGAIEILANEIMNIRNFELVNINRDISQMHAQIMVEMDASLKKEIIDIKDVCQNFEDKINTRINTLNLELMDTKSCIDEAQKLIQFFIKKVEIIDQTHKDRIQALYTANVVTEKEARKMKDELKDCHQKVSLMESREKITQNMLLNLTEKILQIESFHSTKYSALEESFAQSKEITSELQRLIESKELTQKKLLEDLTDVKNDMIQAKITSSESFDELYGVLDSYGINEPKLDEVVKYGSLHENISKEKNYVVPINCIFGTSSDDIDVPSILASFAHDYAEWIAYRSDLDSLKLTVVCKNSNESVDTEDETEERRQSLVACFKKKLFKELENIHPDIGSIRLEARSFYISRVIDAIETALSKHNQVFIPASTRLGRVRSNMSTCVACDRPLSRKTARWQQSEGEKLEDKESKVTNRSSKSLLMGTETQKYIMRGGFKFPLKN